VVLTCYLRGTSSRMAMIVSLLETAPKILYSGLLLLNCFLFILTFWKGILTVKVVMDFQLAHWEKGVRLRTYRMYCQFYISCIVFWISPAHSRPHRVENVTMVCTFHPGIFFRLVVLRTALSMVRGSRVGQVEMVWPGSALWSRLSILPRLNTCPASLGKILPFMTYYFLWVFRFLRDKLISQSYQDIRHSEVCFPCAFSGKITH